MLYHAGVLSNVSVFTWGQWGVDLFFVLSGFLITGILLRTKDRPRFFLNFYGRRALRIWPLYFTVLAVTIWLFPRIVQPQWSFWLFVQNLVTNGHLYRPIAVTWSLAIEEQFYLAWPLVVYLAPRSLLKVTAITVIIGSPILRLFLGGFAPWVNLSANTFTRLDGLAFGALLALLAEEWDATRLRRLGYILLALGVMICATAHFASALLYTGIASLFAGAVAVSTFVPGVPAPRVLTYTGKVSYALYLFHFYVFSMLYAMRPAWITLVCGFALTLVLAYLSWHMLEQPFNNLKRLLV